MCLGGRERAGRPAGSTDGAEACHGSVDDGHILTWDPQLSGSHTSCSGLNRILPPPQSHTHALKTEVQTTAWFATLEDTTEDNTWTSWRSHTAQGVPPCRSVWSADVGAANARAACLSDLEPRCFYRLPASSSFSSTLAPLSSSLPLISPLSPGCPPWLAVHPRAASYIS